MVGCCANLVLGVLPTLTVLLRDDRYLKFENGTKERSQAYATSDVWLLSTCPWFGYPPPGTRSPGAHTFVMQSVWHGPSKKMMLEVAPFGGWCVHVVLPPRPALELTLPWLRWPV